MFRADGERRSFSIARDMTVIGRREDCDLRIPLGDVSRKHCRIVRDGEMLKIEDLGSSNGTFLNAHRVQEALLSPGDSIQVGPVVFVLQIDGEPADDELAPVTMDVSGTGNLADDDDLLTEIDDDNAGAGDGATMDDADVLEEVEEVEELQEDAPTVASGGGDEQMDELEPVEELDPLEPDFDITDDTVEEAEKKQR
jgi:pSer/pThr/pTyr-binding forkhead associated (FHA) protein